MDRISSGLNGHPQLSGFILALVNMIPILGVILWEWTVFEVVGLYWTESVILGILNIPRMLMAKGDREGSTPSKMFFIPFFLFHFGFFCAIHGYFVFFLDATNAVYHNPVTGFPDLLLSVVKNTIWAFLLMLTSHTFSFFWNYIGRREYRHTQVMKQMFQPYHRIMILHILVLFGAFAVVMMDSPIMLLLSLIAFKSTLDIGFHFYAHGESTNEASLDDEMEASTV